MRLKVLRVVATVKKLSHLADDLAEITSGQGDFLRTFDFGKTAAWFLQWVYPMSQEADNQSHHRALSYEKFITWVHLVTVSSQCLVFFDGWRTVRGVGTSQFCCKL